MDVRTQTGKSTFVTAIVAGSAYTPGALDQALLVELQGGSVSIGGVKIEDASSTDSVRVYDANASKVATDHVLMVQTLDKDGLIATSGPRYYGFSPTVLASAGASDTFDNSTYAFDKGSVQYRTTGTPSAVSLQFQGSNDASNWINIGSAFTNTSTDGGTFSDACYKYYRFYLNTLTSNVATGVFTFTGVPSLGETFTVDTQTFTWVASRSGAGEATLGVSDIDCAANAAAAINLDLATVTASAAFSDCLVYAVATGAAGNSIVFDEASSNATMDGAGYLGGYIPGVDATLQVTSFLRS